MAILHRATLSPSKLEVLSAHLQTMPQGQDIDVANVRLVDAYRFDDPAGSVGIECHLVDDGAGNIVHIPVTYRDAPLKGAEGLLISTMDHSVLGPRWVYNACGDPVYVQELVRAILTGGSNVEQLFDTPEGMIPKPSAVSAKGTGEASDADVPLIDSVKIKPALELAGEGELEGEGDVTVIDAGAIGVTVVHGMQELASKPSSLVVSWENHPATVLAFIHEKT